MRIRLQDIAEDLHLSKMTISRVLRGHADVSEQTKARVLQRVQELKYRPNASARGLRTGQTLHVAVLVPSIDDPCYGAVCQGLMAGFQAAGYGVSISATGSNPDLEEAEIDLHLSRNVDALFLAGSSAPHRVRDPGVPVFLLGNGGRGSSAYELTFDESEVGRLPAAWLLDHGARRIAYLRGTRTAANDVRFAGFLKAHRDANVAPQHALAREVRSGDGEYRSAYQAVSEMLREPAPPDAVMANSDLLALGARDAALAAGRRVPEQVQIVGCGNDANLCSIGLSLTSVSVSWEELGARAVKLALKVFAGTDAPAPRSIRVAPLMAPRLTTCRHETAPGTKARRRSRKAAEEVP